MRFFFRSKRFKIILSIVLCLAISIVVFGTFTKWSSPQTNIFGAVLTPLQKLSSSVSASLNGILDKFENNDKLIDENKALKDELAKKNNDLIDYQNAVRQNQFFKDFLEIKQNNPSYKFMPSMVIAKDSSDPFGTFTIDKGILDGVSLYDPVITGEGLVGYIKEASSTQSIVMTILNPSINITAIDNRTRDSGNVSGSAELATKGLCKISYLSRNNSVAVGDFIVSSGAGGVFPSGQIIGTVSEIRKSKSDVNSYAIIEPVVKMSEISDVMIITEFQGQGSIAK